MIWQIQIIDVKNNVRQQVDYEGDEQRAKLLANTLHNNFKKTHKDEFLSYEKPVRGMRHLSKWQHNW